MKYDWISEWLKTEMPGDVTMSLTFAWKQFVKDCNDPDMDKFELRFELVKILTLMDMHPDAKAVLEEMLAEVEAPNLRGNCFLKLGQISEQMSDFPSAIVYYRQALAQVGFDDPEIRYWARNNIAYSLNRLCRYKEAEDFCYGAIGIFPERYNAHKNAGVSHEGQGNYQEAFLCYAKAVHLNPNDARALKHLEELIASHPELDVTIPGMDYQYRLCKNLVTQAKLYHERRQ